MTKQSDGSVNQNRKLTVVEKFYIQENQDKSPKKLSLDIGCSVKLVKQYLAFLAKREQDRLEAESQKAQEQIEKTPEQSPNSVVPIKTDQLMGKKKGAVVMTQAASEVGDASRGRNKMSQRLSQNVTKIRPE